MALKISKNVGLTDIVSDASVLPYIDNVTSQPTSSPTTNGTANATNPNYNPITTEHPIAGSAVTVQLWLYNDDATKRYETITIDPTDSVTTDESNWVQLSADGTTYGAAGAALSMANISTANSGVTFYAKVTSTTQTDTMNKSDIKLTVAGREYAV